MDEAQLEVKHGLVKYKMFKDDASCKEWIEQQTEEEWIGPFHSEKGSFAASSVVIDICRESVVKTSEAYKLNVQLAIDPQFGLNWAQCH